MYGPLPFGFLHFDNGVMRKGRERLGYLIPSSLPIRSPQSGFFSLLKATVPIRNVALFIEQTLKVPITFFHLSLLDFMVVDLPAFAGPVVL